MNEELGVLKVHTGRHHCVINTADVRAECKVPLIIDTPDMSGAPYQVSRTPAFPSAAKHFH